MHAERHATLRERMHQAACRSRPALGDALPKVAECVAARQGPGGGFVGRSGGEDLYYTVFGLEALAAVGAPAPARTAGYLRGFGAGDGLDFVHLTCLARCRAAGGGGADAGAARAMADRLGTFRSADGGFADAPGAPRGTTYAAFLAVGALEDLGADTPRPEELARALDALRTADGGYANEPGRPQGLTAATAGAIVLRRHLGLPGEPPAERWLLERLHPAGGFAAAPATPVPDLLSTATALLALTGRLPGEARRGCLRLLDRAWHEEGGFGAGAFDDGMDTEYTWYGLLALGCLAE